MSAKDSHQVSIAAVGDTMVTRHLSTDPDPGFLALRDTIAAADAAFLNLEGPIGEPSAYPLKPYSFSTYFTGEPWLAAELNWMGFNLASLANNHMSDYSPEMLAANRRLMNEAGIVAAGAGSNLMEARQPEYFDHPSARIALVAIDSSYEHNELVKVQMASDPRGRVPGRPGVNGLRWRQTQVVAPSQLETLKQIQLDLGRTQINKLDLARTEAGDHQFFGSWFRSGNKHQIETRCHPGDLKEVARWIENAAYQSDYVLVSHHSHEREGQRFERPAGYSIELAHAAIDAGAAAYVGHGYGIKGVEIYAGQPIFYDLGYFAQQVESARRHPSDTYEHWDLDPRATPADLARRRRERFGDSVLGQTGIIATMHFDQGKFVRAEATPVALSVSDRAHRRGSPRLATGSQAKEILAFLSEASKGFGTKIRLDGGVGVIQPNPG